MSAQVRKQCPNCLGPMYQVGSEGRSLDDGSTEEFTHWQCQYCTQRAVDTTRRPPPAASATSGARRSEIQKLNSEINRLNGVVMFSGGAKSRRARERRRELKGRRDEVLRAERSRQRLAKQGRARDLAREAGPLGQLDLAVERVCAAGRGDPAPESWTEKPVTERQEEFLARRGWDAVPGTRGEASRAIGQIKEREAAPQASAHVAVDAGGNSARFEDSAQTAATRQELLGRMIHDRLDVLR